MTNANTIHKEISHIDSFGELIDWVNSNNELPDEFVKTIEYHIEKRGFEDHKFEEFAYPHFHGVMLPDDPSTCFELGRLYGNLSTAIDVSYKITKSFTDRQKYLLNRLVFFGLLNKFQHEKEVWKMKQDEVI